MLQIRVAKEEDFHAVRDVYHQVIDILGDSDVGPKWKRGIHPSDEFILTSIINQELYTVLMDGTCVAAMVLNHECDENYSKVVWHAEASKDEIIIVHILGILPTCHRKGIGKYMLEEAIRISRERGQKAIRLDVLSNNVPAQKLYTTMGFEYRESQNLYYENTGWADFLLYELVL